MSSNRLMYDECAYAKRLQQSQGPYYYAMYEGRYQSNSPCRIELGVVGGNNVSVFRGNLVDLESDLLGQTRAASLCPSQKYAPGCKVPRMDGDGTPCGPVPADRLSNLPSCQMWAYPAVQMPNPNPLAPSCVYTTDGRIKYNNKK